MLEAHQLTRRAANVGFDWQDVKGIFDKLAEETAELKELLASRERRTEEIEEEVGDLLFVGVNLARFLGFDAEIALPRRPIANSRSDSEEWSASPRLAGKA